MTKTAALIAGIVLLFAVAMAAVVLAVRGANHADRVATSLQHLSVNNCRGIASIDTVIQGVLTVSDRQLGMPGTAGADYYRTHAAELAKAHRDNAVTLAKFKPALCPGQHPTKH